MTNWDTESEEEPKSVWDTPDVTPRNKALWQADQLVKQGMPRDRMEREFRGWLKANQIQLTDSDIKRIIDWAYWKFGGNGEAQDN